MAPTKASAPVHRADGDRGRGFDQQLGGAINSSATANPPENQDGLDIPEFLKVENRPNPARTRKSSWRDVLPIHPAAELFPLMTDQELDELGADIKKNGLQQRAVILASADSDDMLLDGRNRDGARP